MGKKLMSMAALALTTMSSLLVGLHLSQHDGLWEVACSPHSWLSMAAEEHGLRPRRINLAHGFDLYQESTWLHLRELRRRHRPKKLWLSLPCAKWCAWTSVNYNNPEKQDKLETARRKERRLLWYVNAFIKESLEEDPDMDVYFEWPWPCFGWKQRPMLDLQEHPEAQGVPWLDCRIDGCNYGMMDIKKEFFVKKRWMIRTTDEQFHKVFRSKVCPGNHRHTAIEGQETAVTSYYPWRMVQAITRHWKQQLAPPRHQRLLGLRHDLHDPDDWGLVDPDNESFVMDYDMQEFHDSLHSPESELLGLTSPSADQRATSGKPVGLTSPSADQHATSGESFRRLILQHMSQGNYSIDALEQILLAASHQHQGHIGPHSRWRGSRGSVLVLGAYSHGHISGVSRATSKHAELVRYLNGFFKKHLPHASWSSFMVSFDCPALPHRDYHNMKGSKNRLICLGAFGKGGLWVSGTPPNHLPSVRRRMPDGHVHDGYILSTRHQLVTKLSKTLSIRSGEIRCQPGRISRRSNSEAIPFLRRMPRLRIKGIPPLLPPEPQAMAATSSSLPDYVDEAMYKKWEAQVAKFHRAAGHPTNKNLARIIKEAGHEPWRVQVALDHQCPSCQFLKQGGTSSGLIPPASTTGPAPAWHSVGVDTGEWVVPRSKFKVKFIVLVDVATKLRLVQPLCKYDIMTMRTESTEDVTRAFTERWLSTFPKPHVLLMDSAKSFLSDSFHEFASSLNIQVHFVAEKEHWAHGVVEAVVQDVKMTASAIHLEALDQDPYVTLHLAASALNSTEYTAGYSAFQWAFGKQYSIPDEDVRTFNGCDFQGEYVKLVAARQQAEAIATRTRARRVLSKLANTTVRQPLRQYAPMDLVKIWRREWPKQQFQGPRGKLCKSGRPHWIGPGRVVFSKVLPHQEAGDERRHVVWVLWDRSCTGAPHTL